MTSNEREITKYDEIFNIKESKIFKNSSVLYPSYIPEKLIGRTKEIQDLASLFDLLNSGGYPSNALIYGKTGSGKTVVTRFLLKMLGDLLEANPTMMNHPLLRIYIPCKTISTTNSILYEILKQIDPYTKVARKGYAMSFYYTAIWEAIKAKNVSLVIVLDEIDRIDTGKPSDQDLLYNLSRAGEMQLLPNKHFICLIGITNDLNFKKQLDHRVESSMNPVEFVFTPYNFEQITLILKERVDLAFKEGAVPEDTIYSCARYSAQDQGDARKAIDHLKMAAKYAEENGFNQVLPEHLEAALELMDIDKIQALVQSLPHHEKLVYLAILKLLNSSRQGSTNSQAVTSLYNTLCNEVGTKPLHRTTISTKFNEFQLAGLICPTTVKRGKGGGWNDIRVSIQDTKALEESIYKDCAYEDLKDIRVGYF